MTPNYRTDIEAKKTIAGDFSMNPVSGIGAKATTAPRDITLVNVDMIAIDPKHHRTRTIDMKAVDSLYEDITMTGLLQPIGVQIADKGYHVVYGAHRFLAFQKGWKKALAMREANTDKDPETHKMLRQWQMIPCIIYDYDMPHDYAVLKEISENLKRKGLTNDEVSVNQTKYTHLIKKLKLVVPADEKRTGRPPVQKISDGQTVRDLPKLPTATEKASVDLGVDERTLRRAHQRVNALAGAVARDKGLSKPAKVTPESKPTEAVEQTILNAELAIAEKAKVEKAGGDTRKVHPVQPTAPDTITVRIDLTGPRQLLEWFRGKVSAAGDQKKVTLDYLRNLHAGLGELIDEVSKNA